MVGQIGRVLLQVVAPLRRTEEAHGWANLLWQVIVLMGLSAGAASILISSPFAIIVYLLLIAVGLTFAASYRLQGQAEQAESQRFTRRQLLDARMQLGELMTDAADLLNGVPTDAQAFSHQVIELDGRMLDIFRKEGSAFFDESHVGRHYAAVMEPNADTGTVEGLRTVLRADIVFLNALTAEINAEINALPR